jgi:hypothetical protein
MAKTLRTLALLALPVLPALACQCQMFSTCNEVAATDLVFIGRVESMEPAFLNRWDPSGSSSLKALNDAYFDAQQHPSAQALGRMKDVYLKAFPDAPADRKRQLQGAKTAPAVAALFYASLGRGVRVRFRLEKLFKHEQGDDDDAGKAGRDRNAKDGDGPQKPAPKDDSKKTQEQFLEVWTPFGDCGYAFQTGETYLVYASDNEEAADFISTDSCTRTRRLSEAGEDLAYLYFYKEHPEASTRLDGFTTTNPRYRLDFNPLHPETMPSPVAGAIIELQSDRLTRYVESDRNGRFVFDGLPEGDYKLSAYGQGYPLDTQLLAGPQPFHVPKESCSLQVVVLPKAQPK